MNRNNAAEAQSAPTTAGRGHRINLEAITHRYGGTAVLEGVSLQIEPGELIALLGPSGCGKTTLLRIITGFVAQTAGTVLMDGSSIDALDAGKRGIGIVFQNYALFPHLSILENVAYGPIAQGMGRVRAIELAREMLGRVKMHGFDERRPRELSGGQQQRVALARALAISPRILLLDEPFSALDKALRLNMQSEIKTILKQSGVTSIIVTHDQEEALSMADRIVVLNAGRIEQVGRPMDVYDRPKSLFVGGFIGHMNLLPGRIATSAAGPEIELSTGARLPCPSAAGAPSDASVVLGIRPENLVIAEDGSLHGRVTQILPLGPTEIIEVELPDGQSLRIARPHRSNAPSEMIGDPVALTIADSARCNLFLA